MYIETINSPEDVKKLTIEELPALTEEMRHALLTRAWRTFRTKFRNGGSDHCHALCI